METRPPNHSPPPPPPMPLNYQGPGSSPPVDPSTGFADKVVGLNLRWRDNIIQAVVVFLGAALGGAMAYWMFAPANSAAADCRLIVYVGALIGLAASFMISGVAIGIIRMFRH